MPQPTIASRVFEREFLGLRGKLLELAAAMDRIDRAADGRPQDPRWERVQEALSALHESGSDRAERLQMLFSLPYDPDWKS